MERNKIYHGSALSILKTFPNNSIDMCVTSPPYWNLRNYNTEPEIWDGDINCKHIWGNTQLFKGNKSNHGVGSKSMKLQAVAIQSADINWSSGVFCESCGAWKGQLGLEPTPELYIKHLVQIFSEVYRVLKSTGSCWINIGDTYAIHSNSMGTNYK